MGINDNKVSKVGKREKKVFEILRNVHRHFI